jgi:hypothetical protein
VRIFIGASLLIVLLLSLPFWVPATRSLASEIAPGDLDSIAAAVGPMFIWDSGWITGSMTQRVLEMPRIMAFNGLDEPIWVTETGFPFGSFYDQASNRLFLIEQRGTEEKIEKGLTFDSERLYPPSKNWPLFLTILDTRNGKEISSTQLDAPFVIWANNSIGRPVALRGDLLYIMTYGSGTNLLIFDLKQKSFLDEGLKLCEAGYPTQVHYSNELESTVTLCTDFSTGMDNAVTVTSLRDGLQRSVELPQFGKEEYMSGNAMVLGLNQVAYVLETDAKMIAEIDLIQMSIIREATYAENLTEQETGFVQRAVAWLLEQSARSASAKRWMGITAISPDGRWLAVDGGFGPNHAPRNVYLIDLETLQAERELELAGSPASMVFANDSQLIVFLEKSNFGRDTQAIVFDLFNNGQATVQIPTHSGVYEYLLTY